MSPVHVHETKAQPLGFVSGQGPWALRGSGMKAGSLGAGKPAVFVWLDNGFVRGARADQDHSVTLMAHQGAPLLALRETSRLPTELLLFDSSPRVQAFALECVPP
ncbi:MAG: hypothetical protein JKY37_10200 [Nannocystaceae bacterium]|nr:hypothetical protein [Nannocystaceae bacterium]